MTGKPKFPQLYDKQWLRQRYVKDYGSHSAAVIARELGCNESTVWAALYRAGVSTDRSAARYPLLQDEHWLREQYETKGLNQSAIARGLGCTPNAVNRALTRHGIPKRRGPGSRPAPPKPDFAQLAAWLGMDEQTTRRELERMREHQSTRPPRRLADEIIGRIKDGELVAGDALPSIRTMRDAGHNSDTVMEARRLLVAEGWARAEARRMVVAAGEKHATQRRGAGG